MRTLPSLVLLTLFTWATVPTAAIAQTTQKSTDDLSLHDSSAAILSVNAPRPRGGLSADQIDAWWQREINSQAALLGSRNLMHTVATIPTATASPIGKTEWYKLWSGDRNAENWLVEHVKVRVIPGTRLISLSIAAPPNEISPQDRRVLLMEIAEEHMRQQTKNFENQRVDQLQDVTTKKVHLESDLRAAKRDADELSAKSARTAEEDKKLAELHAISASLRGRIEHLDVEYDDIGGMHTPPPIVWEQKPIAE